jgi:hypothetical protein
MKDLRSRFPVYSALLHLYPKPYRERYEEEILQTTADLLDDTTNSGDRFNIWSRIALDLPVNMYRQQLRYVGGVMTNETPNYLKRNSLVSAILLLPFILALAANGLSKVITGQGLYHSWLWTHPVLGIWILYLPELALVLALATYFTYTVRDNGKVRRPWIQRAIDLKHVWSLAVPATVAFGILFLVGFHDSAQCWVQNPTHAVTHLHQAWQCTTNNQSLQAFTRP